MTTSQQQAKVRNTSCFSAPNLARLEQIMYDVHIAAGAYVYWEGDCADKLYYVKQGQVRITKATDEGKQLTLFLYLPGDLFGQIDSMQGSHHSFSAEAEENCVLGVIQQKDLEVLLWQHGDLAIEFMGWMGQLHRITQTKFRDLMLFGKPGALCSVLIRLGNSYGVEAATGTLISRRVTNSELAEMIGATRESVNRLLSDLKKKDVIDYEDNLIIIKNLHYLKNVCRCEDCPGNICRI